MRKLLLTALFAAVAHGQAPDVTQGPVALTGLGSGTPVFVGAGGTAAIVGWRLTYFVDGTNFTAAAMAIQGADAPNAAGCASASYTTITTGTSNLVEVNNPSSSGAQGNVGLKTYYPCIKATVTGVTGSAGTITYTLTGWKNLFAFPVTATFTPSGTQDVNEVGINGVAPTVNTGNATNGTQRVVLATNQPAVTVGGAAAVGAPLSGNPLPQGLQNSAGIVTPEYCTSKFAFSNPSTGSTQLVAVSGSTTIRVCEFFFSGDTLSTFQLVTGTGSGCTTPTAQTGIMSGPGGGLFGVALSFPTGALVTASSATLCLSLSAGSTGGGYITFTQR